MTQDEKPMKTLGAVQVDARGRIYLKRLSTQMPSGAMYLVDVEEPEGVEPTEAPRTIRLRLIEGER